MTAVAGRIATGARGGSSPGFYYALEGAIPAPEFDYMDVGEMLYRGLRVDYTYLHPEVLTGRCRVDGQRLVLDNRENREEFRVLIIPGGDTISASRLGDLPGQIAAVVRPAPRAITWRPMRSPWWILPFTLALAGEWWLRRRRGLA